MKKFCVSSNSTTSLATMIFLSLLVSTSCQRIEFPLMITVPVNTDASQISNSLSDCIHERRDNDIKQQDTFGLLSKPSHETSQHPSNKTTMPPYTPLLTPSNASHQLTLLSDVPIDDETEIATQAAVLMGCDDRGQSGSSGPRSYNFHGQCRTCPSVILSSIYPFLLLLVVTAIIVILQNVVAMKLDVVVWVGIEYLQMLSLFGIITPIVWPKVADVIFSKVLPLFAMDLNAAISLQCILGWSSPEPDFVWFLCVPPLIWVVMTIVSKVSKERIVRDRSISRWTVFLIYLGHTKLLLTSFEAIQCDPGSSSTWIGCDGKIYASVAGIIGLLVYGFVFPVWFLRASFIHAENEGRVDAARQRYNDEQHDVEKDEIQKVSENGIGMDPNDVDLFMVMGIFPIFRSGTWWWSGVWMMRKMCFSLVGLLFSDAPILLLVVFVVVLLVTEIIQRCVMPLEIPFSESDSSCVKLWARASKVDTACQVSLLAFAGLGFLLLSGTDSSMNEHHFSIVVDILLLVVLAASLLYWFLAIVVTSRSKCERFSTRVLMVDTNNSQDNGARSVNTGPKAIDSDQSVSSSSGYSVGRNYTSSSKTAAGAIPLNLSMLPGMGSTNHSSGSSNRNSPADRILDMLNEDSLTEYVRSASISINRRNDSLSIPSSYNSNRVEDDNTAYDESTTHTDFEIGESSVRSSVYRDESIASFQSMARDEEDEDMVTVLEEVYIDESTGLPVDASRGQWAIVDEPIEA